jgi:hypothetical protein
MPIGKFFMLTIFYAVKLDENFTISKRERIKLRPLLLPPPLYPASLDGIG